MNIVVTGGAGFIGANLCRDLLAAIPTWNGSWRSTISRPAPFQSRRPRRRGAGRGLRSSTPACSTRLLAGADAVVHLAARPSVPRSLEDPVASHEANATGTVRVLEAARRRGRPQVMVASSSSVYGANPALPKREDMATMPVSPYAASKLATESDALAYGHSFGLPVLAFRFFNVFGPLQAADHAYAAVVPTFVAAALRGDPLPVHGDGGQTRDFTFVGTVTAVLADAVRAPGDRAPVRSTWPSGRGSPCSSSSPASRVLGKDLTAARRAPARRRARLTGRPAPAPGPVPRHRAGRAARGPPVHPRLVPGCRLSPSPAPSTRHPLRAAPAEGEAGPPPGPSWWLSVLAAGLASATATDPPASTAGGSPATPTPHSTVRLTELGALRCWWSGLRRGGAWWWAATGGGRWPAWPLPPWPPWWSSGIKPFVARRYVGVLTFPRGTWPTSPHWMPPGPSPSPFLGIPLVIVVGGRWSPAAVIGLRWHYPSDALGGAVFGVGVVLLVDGVAHLSFPGSPYSHQR